MVYLMYFFKIKLYGNPQSIDKSIPTKMLANHFSIRTFWGLPSANLICLWKITIFDR